MASPEQWAYVLRKLGSPYKKKDIIAWINTQATSEEHAWNHFVQSDPAMLKAANASRLYKADDIDWFLREAGYVRMRGTFPRRSNNRSILGPSLISVQRLAEEEYQQKKSKGKLTLADIPIPEKLVRSRIIHSQFGVGTITKLSDSGLITVEFDDGQTKTLNYRYCILNELIKPAPKHRV